jgi:hypothetical protein
MTVAVARGWNRAIDRDFRLRLHEINESCVETIRLMRNLPMPMKRFLRLIVPLPVLLFGGCLSLKTEPIEVKPIHITVDVNVKVDKALDDFFGDLDKKATTPRS